MSRVGICIIDLSCKHNHFALLSTCIEKLLKVTVMTEKIDQNQQTTDVHYVIETANNEKYVRWFIGQERSYERNS